MSDDEFYRMDLLREQYLGIEDSVSLFKRKEEDHEEELKDTDKR